MNHRHSHVVFPARFRTDSVRRLVLLAMAALGSSATVRAQVFDDRAAFEAVVGDAPVIFETFNSIGPQRSLRDPVVLPQLTIQAFEDGNPGSAIIGGGVEDDVNGTSFVRARIDEVGEPEIITITFDQPVVAVAFELLTRTAPGVEVDLMTETGGMATFTLPDSADTVEFRGILFSNDFTTLTIAAGAGDAQHSFDDVAAYGSESIVVPALPPAGLALTALLVLTAAVVVLRRSPVAG
ncbi:MAG: hypothetical protein AAF533_19210 [Acidobacteriota bacterium]